MIEIILTDPQDRIWKAVIKVGEELFQATILQGSATEDWKASLHPISFIPLTEGNKLTEAVERELERLKREEEFGIEVARLIERNPVVKQALDNLKNEQIGSTGSGDGTGRIDQQIEKKEVRRDELKF